MTPHLVRQGHSVHLVTEGQSAKALTFALLVLEADLVLQRGDHQRALGLSQELYHAGRQWGESHGYFSSSPDGMLSELYSKHVGR